MFITLIMLNACTSKKNSDNPLLKAYDTPFNTPPFDKIKNEHFKPAFEEAMKMHVSEIEQIVNNSEAPTFANTVEALDYSGFQLAEVSGVFYNLQSANTNDDIQAIATEIAPIISEHFDNIWLNPKLFEKVKAVFDQKAQLSLNPEQTRLLDETYKRFIRGGAGLNAEQQKRFREINQQLSVIELKVGDNILAETNKFKMVVENKDELKGLPQTALDAATQAAKEAGMEGKYVFTLQSPSLFPFLQYAENRELRQKIQQGYVNRCNYGDSLDNKENIDKIVNLRIEKANMLGYKTWADFVLSETMAKTPDKVYDFMKKIWEPALVVAKNEAKELQSMMSRELGTGAKLEAWDWRYYAEKLRKEKYDLDDEQLRPYFKLENVRDGIFELTKRLFGLQYKELTDVPKYHPDVMVYDVQDADGSHLGVLYMDFFPRESKRGGAWMNNYREQFRGKDGKDVRPVIGIVGNFTKPTADQPSLLNFEEVSTFYHEFGHALHGLLSKCTYRSLSGTNVPRDFVELPSQIMENWASEPEMLALYAKHYQTGEIIPQQLVDKMKQATYFNKGFEVVEYTSAAYLDMDLHTLTQPQKISANDFEKASMDRIGMIPEIVVRYRLPYYMHIFVHGYSAGYYSYLWAEVLDADAFEAFKETSLFNPEVAKAFRTNVLEKGGTEDPMALYTAFRGREPDIKPVLKRKGLLK